MGRKEKLNTKAILTKHDEDNFNGDLTPPLVFSSDEDDDEANQDLSLKIVEKAMRMRAAKHAPNDDVLNAASGVVSSSHKPELAVAQNDSVSAIADSQLTKKKKTTKLKVEAVAVDQSVIIAEEQRMEETVGAEQDMEETIKSAVTHEPVEGSTDQIGDNMVLRKLLRGPRYFDPLGSSWGACFNCGEEGHAAVNCPVAKRRKPCYVCGGLGHNAKQCIKAQDCFICKKGNHHAKDCPEKHASISKSVVVCLKCGNSGHDMFSCRNDYSTDDLKEIQCYVCKRLGHLCCVSTSDATPGEISCYKCGQLGHTGLACSRLRNEIASGAPPSSCFKCGEEGHFARECTSSIRACSRLRDEIASVGTSSSCFKCGEGGHFARECKSSIKAGKRNRESSYTTDKRSQKENDYMGNRSAPNRMGGAWKKKRSSTDETGFSTPKHSKSRGGWMEYPSEERGFTTPKKSKSRGGWTTEHSSEQKGYTTPKNSKSRGGWMAEHPGEFFPPTSTGRSFRYSGTPSSRNTKVHSFGSGSHTPSSTSSNVWNGYAGSSMSQGSARSNHHRFSASRFGNSSNGGHVRNYNWW